VLTGADKGTYPKESFDEGLGSLCKYSAKDRPRERNRRHGKNVASNE